jgi:beta-mannosidase
MKLEHDLSQPTWTLTGYTPYLWRFHHAPGIGDTSVADTLPVRAHVPGSVQQTLLDEGMLRDWNQGLNSRDGEWVENRHWIYTTRIPAEWLDVEGKTVRLVCDGLDYSGWVRLDGEDVGGFRGTHIPHTFDLTPHIKTNDESEHRLEIIFDCPPRWLGQFGYTSQMTEFKPRYNYTWDWISRIVQIGIWGDIRLEITDTHELDDVYIGTDYDLAHETGILSVSFDWPDDDGWGARLTLNGVRSDQYKLNKGTNTILWADLGVEPWWPNGYGEASIYELSLTLLDPDGVEQDRIERRVGFKHVEWIPCEGAPPEADPWICVVNNEPVFLGGINWTPIRPNFADTTLEEYQNRLETYQEMGCTVLRVWGGGYLETDAFYNLCDDLGLLVWQEFPLSSSGLDNYPPDDPDTIDELATIAESYIRRRRHHASLLMWCGGNELTQVPPGETEGMGPPITSDHPLVPKLKEIVNTLDPGRRFIATSPLGPTFGAEPENFGKGVHWCVHGPWKPEGTLEEWAEYWENDDALFRSEVGCPGASSVGIIEQYRGDHVTFPASHANPLWRRTAWWIEWKTFIEEHGGEPDDLAQYVSWSQDRQARALEIAAGASRRRFPGCGGFIVWMGHDSFPCTANTSLLDIHGEMKPAAHALAGVFNADM